MRNVYKPIFKLKCMNTGRKISGGKYHKKKKKKLYEKKGQERIVLLGELKRKTIKTKGGIRKRILLSTNTANVIAKNKIVRAEIKNVLETPQNRFLARQNRLMKGVIIETSLGKAKITNRPSREGSVNAILIEEK